MRGRQATFIPGPPPSVIESRPGPGLAPRQVALTDITVAIIGTGTIGSTLAANFAAGGQDFLLAGKVIVDPSNPVGPDGAGGYRKVIGEQESSGQILAGLLPAGARLVKAFGTLSAPSLAAAAWREPERAVQFYAADDAAAGDLVADLIRVDGFEPVRVGGLDQAIRIEMFGDLHEYGALGRVVTESEALKAI